MPNVSNLSFVDKLKAAWNSGASRIEYSYVLLTCIGTVGVMWCVFLSTKITLIHERSIHYNVHWTHRINEYVSLRAKTAEIADTTGKAMESGNTEMGIANLAVKSKAIQEKLEELRRDIHSGNTDELEAGAYLGKIQAAIGVLEVDAVSLLKAFKPGQVASRSLDHDVSEVNAAITGLTTMIRSKQLANAKQAQVDGRSVVHAQYWAVGMTSPLMVALMVVGWRVSRRLTKSVEERHVAIQRLEARSVELVAALSERAGVLATMSECVLFATTDASGRITDVNSRFCDISGYSLEELVGQDHSLFDTDLVCGELRSSVYATLSSGAVWHGEIQSRAKDGRLIYLDTAIKGVLDSSGTLTKTVTVRIDITERKAAAAHLIQSQRLEAVGQLAAGIAHEINTPTQYVSDNVRFLQSSFQNIFTILDGYQNKSELPVLLNEASGQSSDIEKKLANIDYAFLRQEIPSAIAQSIDGLDRVSSIVKAMKDFSHPGSTFMESMDINRAIASTIEVCRHRWKYIAELTTDFSTDIPAVPCLIAEFNQVILNLIVNAADAIAEQNQGGESTTGRIHISTRVVNNMVEVQVADSGSGMTEHVKHHIFEPFFTTKPVGKGTGQGLMLSRDIIVKKHGGKLLFDSTLGVGTTFIVQLPLTPEKSSSSQAA